MIRQIFAVTSKELNVLWRDREALALLFAMPVFFILVMSLALQGVFESGSRDRPIEILLINEDRGGLAAKAILDLKKMDKFMIIDTLDGMPVTLKKAKDLILHEKHTMALRFKAQFSAQILSSTMDAKNDDSVISLIVDPTTNMPLISSLKSSAILSEISDINFWRFFSFSRFFCEGIRSGSSGSIKEGRLMLVTSE